MKEMIVRLIDDVDGGEAVEELTFALRGVEYEIDLSEKNVAALEKVFEKYTQAGHRVVHHRAPRGGAVKRAKAAKEDTAAIREWARASGYEVSNRGRISAEIRAAYEAAP